MSRCIATLFILHIIVEHPGDDIARRNRTETPRATSPMAQSANGGAGARAQASHRRNVIRIFLRRCCVADISQHVATLRQVGAVRYRIRRALWKLIAPKPDCQCRAAALRGATGHRRKAAQRPSTVPELRNCMFKMCMGISIEKLSHDDVAMHRRRHISQLSDSNTRKTT